MLRLPRKRESFFSLNDTASPSRSHLRSWSRYSTHFSFWYSGLRGNGRE